MTKTLLAAARIWRRSPVRLPAGWLWPRSEATFSWLLLVRTGYGGHHWRMKKRRHWSWLIGLGQNLESRIRGCSQRASSCSDQTPKCRDRWEMSSFHQNLSMTEHRRGDRTCQHLYKSPGRNHVFSLSCGRPAPALTLKPARQKLQFSNSLHQFQSRYKGLATRDSKSALPIHHHVAPETQLAMEMTIEAIVAIIALVVALPPTVFLVVTWIRRCRMVRAKTSCQYRVEGEVDKVSELTWSN